MARFCESTFLNGSSNAAIGIAGVGLSVMHVPGLGNEPSRPVWQRGQAGGFRGRCLNFLYSCLSSSLPSKPLFLLLPGSSWSIQYELGERRSGFLFLDFYSCNPSLRTSSHPEKSASASAAAPQTFVIFYSFRRNEETRFGSVSVLQTSVQLDESNRRPFLRMNFCSLSLSLSLSHTHTHTPTRTPNLSRMVAVSLTHAQPRPRWNLLSGSVLFIEPVRKYSTQRDSRVSGWLQSKIARTERSGGEIDRTGGSESYLTGWGQHLRQVLMLTDTFCWYLKKRSGFINDAYLQSKFINNIFFVS